MGIDDKAVSLGVSMDKRIGNYGTQFGKPFEGACLPKECIYFGIEGLYILLWYLEIECFHWGDRYILLAYLLLHYYS